MGLLVRVAFLGVGAMVLNAAPGGSLIEKAHAVAQSGAGYVAEAARAVDMQKITRDTVSSLRDMAGDASRRQDK